MEKEELIKLLAAGNEVYATSYESEKEVAEALNVDQSQVKYIKQYDDVDLEYNDLQFVDGDMIYIINRSYED
ncbi:MAG: hypothetical protein ACK5NA_08425 [Enterococcus sp.]